MKQFPGILLKCLLTVVAVVCVYSFFTMRTDIKAKQNEIDHVVSQTKEQRIRNQEYRELLDDKNADDFYKSVAEDDLGYGKINEKVYINISGK